MFELHEINVFYGAMQALWNISLRVDDNEVVGLIGPNGHGKTTILKTISGLLTPATGLIKFDGKIINKTSPVERVKMGIIQVPQGQHLFPKMTVVENLKLGAYTDSAWKEKDRNLKMVFNLFPILKERKDQKCSTLSGGERQMVAIARGLMSSAKLLMLDEPSMGLAPKLADELFEKIREIKETGISMILVEQNVVVATQLTDYMYLVENGSISLEGRKEQIIKNKYVMQAYLGKI